MTGPDRIIPLHISVQDGALLDRMAERHAPEGVDPHDPNYQRELLESIVGDRLLEEEASGPLPAADRTDWAAQS